MSQLKLSYFDAPGRAESIRVAMFIAGVEYEDHRIGFADFATLKAQGAFPLGSVPVLEVDGVVYAQTAAILRYVGRVGGGDLYPTDPPKALIVDSALDTFNDTLTNAMLPSLYETDMAKKLVLRAVFSAGPMLVCCASVEAMLTRSGGPFVTGANLTIADIAIALQTLQIRNGGLDGVDPKTLDVYPRLLALTEAYLAEPRVLVYRASKA